MYAPNPATQQTSPCARAAFCAGQHTAHVIIAQVTLLDLPGACDA